MKKTKKIVSLILSLTLLFALTIPTQATSGNCTPNIISDTPANVQ